ncbi:hypothetical protein [uncultured Pontibacter sp.]|nr:hypothetical protein [uncultured Pontibacter sp.]
MKRAGGKAVDKQQLASIALVQVASSSLKSIAIASMAFETN